MFFQTRKKNAIRSVKGRLNLVLVGNREVMPDVDQHRNSPYQRQGYGSLDLQHNMN